MDRVNDPFPRHWGSWLLFSVYKQQSQRTIVIFHLSLLQHQQQTLKKIRAKNMHNYFSLESVTTQQSWMAKMYFIHSKSNSCICNWAQKSQNPTSFGLHCSHLRAVVIIVLNQYKYPEATIPQSYFAQNSRVHERKKENKQTL